VQLAQIGSDVFVIWNVADEPCGGVLETLKWLECRLRKFRPYRSYHSTETAILKVMSDIFLALDSGDLAILPLLDLSATFDTVDHYILLKRLNISYRISHSVLGWLTRYLSNRTQFLQLNGSCSKSSVVTCGVPQGLVLGPILFFLYTADLTRLVDAHNLQVHMYADDTQVHASVIQRVQQVLRMPFLPVSTTYLRG